MRNRVVIVVALLSLSAAACGGDGSDIPGRVQSARRPRLPVAVAVVGVRGRRRDDRDRAAACDSDRGDAEERRRASSSIRRGSIAGTASRRRADARRVPDRRLGRRAAVVEEPRRVARGRLADRARSTSTPASARRSSPRSTRTRRTSTKRDLIIRPLARLEPGARYVGRDPQGGQGRRRRRAGEPAGIRGRCSPATATVTRGSTSQEALADDRSRRSRPPASTRATSCSRGTSSPRPTSSCAAI